LVRRTTVNSHPHTTGQKPILVFLPVGAANVIVSKLVEHGYVANAVSSVPELFDAVRSDRYSLVVTTRPEIDIVRNIRTLPVVNLEVFFHATASLGDGTQFDGKAFIYRIKALTEPRLGRSGATKIQDDGTGRADESPVRASRWRIAARLLPWSRTAATAADR
jgi:hypothetical protein